MLAKSCKVKFFLKPFLMEQRKLKTKEQVICIDAPVQAPVEERRFLLSCPV